MGLFDRRTPPQRSVLPTPHGPADSPLPDADPPAEVLADVEAALLDDEDDADEAPIVPVWPARPGGPNDASGAAADAALTPVVPIVPAVLADARGTGTGGGADDASVPAADEVAVEPAAGDQAADEQAAVEPAAGEAAPAAQVTVAQVAVEAAPAAPAATATGHTVDELNPAERIWLAQQRALVADLCDDPADAAAVAALFDRVRAQWAEAAERPDPRPLADAFGVALGDLVAGQAPALRWAAASDRYGTEIVLAHSTPEVLVYPLASVGQYWEDARPGWFADQVERLTQTVRAALAAG